MAFPYITVLSKHVTHYDTYLWLFVLYNLRWYPRYLLSSIRMP